MAALIFLWLNLVASLFKSKSRLEAENAALRQELTVLQRKVRGRVRFINNDRLFFIQPYRWFPSILKAIKIIRPAILFAGIVPDFAAAGVGISELGRPTANRLGFAGLDPSDEC